MQMFHHLANDELLVLYEEHRNRVQDLVSAARRHEEGALRRKQDLEEEMVLMRAEISNRAPERGSRDFRRLQ